MSKVYGQCKKCGKNLRQRGIAAAGMCRACQWLELILKQPPRKPAPSAPSPLKRMLRLRAFGFAEPVPCFGLGWQTMNREKCLAFETWRDWDAYTVVPMIERFMRGVRGAWPEWLPPQEPVVEVFDCYVKG